MPNGDFWTSAPPNWHRKREVDRLRQALERAGIPAKGAVRPPLPSYAQQVAPPPPKPGWQEVLEALTYPLKPVAEPYYTSVAEPTAAAVTGLARGRAPWDIEKRVEEFRGLPLWAQIPISAVTDPLNLLPVVGFGGPIARGVSRLARPLERLPGAATTELGFAKGIPLSLADKAEGLGVPASKVAEEWQKLKTTYNLPKEASPDIFQLPSGEIRLAPTVPMTKVLKGESLGDMDKASVVLKPAPGAVPKAEAIPPTKPPVGQAPEVPIGNAIVNDLARATEMIRQNPAGVPAKLMDIIPGLKQARRWFAPATAMPEHIRSAYVAETITRTELATQASSIRVPILNNIQRLFGKDVLHGEKAAIKFLGTAKQAENPITNTFLDIAQNPELYALNDAQKTFLNSAEAQRVRFLNLANEEYLTEIGQFKPKPDGMHLSNVDISEDALEVIGSEMRAVASGRTKTRIWPTARDRMAHDPTFKPQTNIELLLSGMDNAIVRAASGQTFRAGLKGKTRLEVMQITHPKLAEWMLGVRKRLNNLRSTARGLNKELDEAIDTFNASPMEDGDLNALLAALPPKVKPGRYMAKGSPLVGKDIKAINAEITAARAEIQKLKPAWKAANLKGYTVVQEGIYRYFPSQEAQQIKGLLKVSDNRLETFLEATRNISLNLDTSLVTGVQVPLAFFADPLGFAKVAGQQIGMAARAGQPFRAFSRSAFMEDVTNNLKSYQEFAWSRGYAVSALTPEEFAGSILKRIPGYKTANEGMFTYLTRTTKAMWDDAVRSLEKAGFSHDVAVVAAGDQVGKVVPLYQPALLGISPARQKLYRSLVISGSFIIRPAELMVDGTRAYAKLGIGKTLTPKERLAARYLTTSIGTITAISIMSNLKYSHDKGLDLDKAALESITPGNRKFWSLVLPNGWVIGLGGPLRSLAKAIMPQEVAGSPIPIPFGGIPNWLIQKGIPLIRTQLDLLRNKDFYGNKIITGEFPENILRGLAYEIEGLAPLVGREAITGIRERKGAEEIGVAVAGQFLGQNLRLETPFQERTEEVRIWAKQHGIEGVESYYDLSVQQRRDFEATQPEVVKAISEDISRRAKLGQEKAIFQEAKQKLYAQKVEQDEWLDRGIDSFDNPFTVKQWREKRDEFYIMQSQDIATKERLLGPFKDRKPKNEKEKALQDYYKIGDRYQAEAEQPGRGGQVDVKALVQEQEKYLAGLPLEMETWLLEQLGGSGTPVDDEFRQDKRVIKPYWDSQDALKQKYAAQDKAVKLLLAQRISPTLWPQGIKNYIKFLQAQGQSYRMRNPEVDALLVKWGYFQNPQNPLNKIREKQRELRAVAGVR